MLSGRLGGTRGDPGSFPDRFLEFARKPESGLRNYMYQMHTYSIQSHGTCAFATVFSPPHKFKILTTEKLETLRNALIVSP